MKPAERNYSVTELEALAVVAALSHFDYYLYGKPVKIVTDHKACLALMSRRSLNKRMLRFAIALQGREVIVVHRAGVDHGNADGLSRQAWQEIDAVATPDCSASPLGLGLAGGAVGMATEGMSLKE